MHELNIRKQNKVNKGRKSGKKSVLGEKKHAKMYRRMKSHSIVQGGAP